MDNLSKHTILRYLKGELSESERFAFEKQMLDDPFLNDAVEGFSHLHVDELEKELAVLEEGIKKIPVQSSNKTWYWAAAAVLLLLSVSVFFFLPDQPISKDSIALAPKEDVDEFSETEESEMEEFQAVEPENDLVLTETKATTPPAEDKEVPPTNELAATPVERQPEVIGLADLTVEEMVPEDDTEVADLADEAAIEEMQLQTAPAVAKAEEARTNEPDVKEQKASGARIRNERSKRAKASTAPSAALASESFSGKVTFNGEPIVGANVFVEEGPGIFTTSSGSFIWPFQQKNLLIVKNGYGDGEISNLDDVVLSPAIKSEYEIKNEDRIFDRMPGPVGGRQAFLQYLKRRLTYPEDAESNGVEGMVSLSIDINEEGEIIGIVPVVRLENGCTEEAIRLVNQGPEWIPGIVEGDFIPVTILINVLFELE